MCKGYVFLIKVQGCRRWCWKETSPNQSCARSTGSALLSRLRPPGRASQSGPAVSRRRSSSSSSSSSSLSQSGPAASRRRSSSSAILLVVFIMICRTPLLEWNCSLATSIVEIFLSFGRREVYVDHAIMTLSGSQPTCFRFISVGDPDYIYLHFLFERTTITKSYGRTLWQLLQLAKSLTTWSQSSPSSSILSS